MICFYVGSLHQPFFSWDGVRSGFGKAAISQQALNCTSWRLEGNVSRDIQHTTVDLIQARKTGGSYSRVRNFLASVVLSIQ